MQTIEVSPGPEDFALQEDGPRGPRLLVAARDRRGDEPGRIWSIDIPSGDAKELVLPKKVWPAGLTIVGHQMYLTNRTSIEVFELDGDTITGGIPSANAELKSTNDVVAGSDGELYVSDFEAGIVYRVIDTEWTRFASDIDGPNGLATDEERLFVSAFGAKELQVYRCNSGEKIRTIELADHPDNLQWEVKGRLLDVAAHTNKWKLGGHMFVSPSISSRSRGYRVNVVTGAVDELYDFTDFDGGSTALVYEGKLYVSQVIGKHIRVQDVV